MSEVYVSVPQKRYEELIEAEKVYKKGVCRLYSYTAFGMSGYIYRNIETFNADEGMKLLGEKVQKLEDKLEERKWYQFVELKDGTHG